MTTQHADVIIPFAVRFLRYMTDKKISAAFHLRIVQKNVIKIKFRFERCTQLVAVVKTDKMYVYFIEKHGLNCIHSHLLKNK